ncbi:MAG: hypothetical protein JWM48_1841 [Mycobacterium sp.]|nr:hypothetical protein [Mycobacterium sp.]
MAVVRRPRPEPVTLPLDEDWEVVATFARAPGRLVIESLLVRPIDGLPSLSGLTSEVLRKVSLGRILQAANPGLPAGALEEDPSDEDLGKATRVLLRMIAQQLHRGPGSAEANARALAAFAQAYLDLTEAGERHPIAALAEEFGISSGTAAQRIKTARSRGLLTSPEPGRVGGELTQAGRQLLQDVQDMRNRGQEKS